MCHRFLPVPLSSGAVMRICGPGPILRASIHISGSGRVQSARVYMHTRIHIYMHTPAHRGAAGLPQGFRLRPNAGAGPFCGPWHTHCAAAGLCIRIPHEVRAGPRRCGRGALPTAPTKPRVVPGSPWRGCSPGGHLLPHLPRQPLAWLLSGGHPAPHLPPSYALASPSRGTRAPPARAYPSDVVPPSRAPRRPPAGPPRPRSAPAQPQPRRPTGGRFRRGLGVMRARPRPRPGYVAQAPPKRKCKINHFRGRQAGHSGI